METRLFAFVEPREPAIERKIIQFSDLPLTYSEYIAPDGGMGWARVLVIEKSGGNDEGIFLFRHTSDGSFAGDTWHETIEDAKHQADVEFEDLLGEWREAPPGISEIIDLVKYALSFDPN